MANSKQYDICKAIRREDKDAYDIAIQEITAIGYIPAIRDNKLDFVFVGPLPDDEKKSYATYLENIYNEAIDNKAVKKSMSEYLSNEDESEYSSYSDVDGNNGNENNTPIILLGVGIILVVIVWISKSMNKAAYSYGGM